MTAAPRPRLLVLNQYYRPGLEATAYLLSDLCAALADEYDVTVIAGAIDALDAPPGHTHHDGVEVIRTRSTSHDRTRMSRRAVNYVTYLADGLVQALRQLRPDVVLAMTDPPLVADVALVVARRFRAPLVVVSQDVFPEVALEVGQLRDGLAASLLRRLVGAYLHRADRVVAIGETMRRRLEEKGTPPERIRVIPNWVDADGLRPQPRDNAWARAHGLEDAFVVMHSGNVGHAANVDTLVRASTELRDVEDLVVLVVGGGARSAHVQRLASSLGADSVRFLPYQPREMLPLSLSAATVHVVGLAKGLSGYVVPSRLYGVLAAGRPVIVAADADSETARVVEQVGCGVVVPPDRPDLLAAEIRRMRDGVYDLEAMGARGRAYVEAEADRSVAVARYREVLAELVHR